MTDLQLIQRELASLAERIKALASPGDELSIIAARVETVSHTLECADLTTARAIAAFDGDRLRHWEEIEADAIMIGLRHNSANISKTATDLNIGRSTIYRRLRDMGVNTKRIEA
jgi:DNA-binding NtrC family response regulator